MTLTDYRH